MGEIKPEPVPTISAGAVPGEVPVVRQGLRPPRGVIGRGRRGVAEEKIRPRQLQYPVLCQAFARTRNQEKGQEEHSRQASGEHGPVE